MFQRILPTSFTSHLKSIQDNKLVQLLLQAAAIATFLCVLVFNSAAAQAEINTNKKGLALKGYDPVAYFTLKDAVKGDASISTVHAGATYHFASDEHRKLFKKTPEKYLPQYNGFCAYGVTKNRKFDIDPKAWEVVNGKLYLNLNKRVRKIWNKDQANFITEADSNWLKIENISDKELAKDW